MARRLGTLAMMPFGVLVTAACTDSSGTTDPAGSTASPTSTMASGVPSTAPTTTVPPTTTAAPTTTVPPTTTIPYVTQGASVMVSNACGVGGAAGSLSDRLSALGFEMVSPTDSALGVREQEVTEIYFTSDNEAAIDVASSVHDALELPGRQIFEVGIPAPTRSGGLDGADVLVLLGCDLASS